MNALRRYLRRQLDDERGSITPMLVVFVPMLVIIVGLVVDSAGRNQAYDNAQSVAAGASRSAANALASQVVVNGTISLDQGKARQVATDYINAAGMRGSVDVVGDRIVVTVRTEYATKFVSALGITVLPAEATVDAQLITQ